METNYVYSSFWSVQLEDYRVWYSSNSQQSYVHPIYPNNLFHNLQIFVKSFTLLVADSTKIFRKAGKIAMQRM